ncbi:Hypothetical predicted protein [Octopus vulgaris]|uniref:Uncharacterized protein n=1 Tax=Octopus vulgaris TaxID=6645 RepID=A0AA36FBF6_OCTVU|nr:Hypothetical predicted protein [Octopus vulgaris]
MAMTKLRNNDCLTSFQTTCDNKLVGITDKTDIESSWFAFKNAVFESSCEALGIKKTDLVHHPILDHLPAVDPTVYADGKVLKTVSSFTYVGSIMSNVAKMDKKIESSIGKASFAFGKLYHRHWNSHDVSLKMKLVLTILLYGAES